MIFSGTSAFFGTFGFLNENIKVRKVIVEKTEVPIIYNTLTGTPRYFVLTGTTTLDFLINNNG